MCIGRHADQCAADADESVVKLVDAGHPTTSGRRAVTAMDFGIATADRSG
jgi:hypothetical protein